LIPPSPTAPPSPPISAYLYLAQLSEEEPHLALHYYQTAVDSLQAQLKGKSKAKVNDKNDEEETKQTIVRALIGMVEIWMDPAYDLWYVAPNHA
jgi:hypothetical protein